MKGEELYLFYPNFNNVPSESTVEYLSNHFIINNLSPKAWLIVPTRNEEKSLGYDGEIVNNKLAFVQYKRVEVKTSGFLTITFNRQQHETLVKNFPAKNTPYVFYAFNLNENNFNIKRDFDKATSHFKNDFFSKTIFLDIHDLVHNKQKEFSIRFHPDLKKFGQSNIHNFWNGSIFWNGPSFINQYQNCQVGILIKKIEENNVSLNLFSLDKVNVIICPEEELKYTNL